MSIRNHLLAWLLIANLGSAATPSVAVAVAVAPQYDTAHVYVSPEDFDKFVASLLATFGGTASKESVFTVTPTPSSTMSQLVMTPVGTVSVFGFKTPIPYPFGLERTGYLVNDIESAVRQAKAAGADIMVSPFDDPIGRDFIIQLPGGVNTQIYWHTKTPSYPPLHSIPENRVYISSMKVQDFIRSFLAFSDGKVVADDPHSAGVEIGRAGDSCRRIRVTSAFGRLTVFVTDGKLPYPYGRETTGYEVENLADTIAKATMAGANVLIAPYTTSERSAAMIQFPGGYIAEIHSLIK